MPPRAKIFARGGINDTRSLFSAEFAVIYTRGARCPCLPALKILLSHHLHECVSSVTTGKQ